jgi:hypothetical protein
MNTERIKEIQSKTAYPESVSVQQALLQVWNECEQEQLRIGAVSKSEVFEHYGKPFTSGRDLWDFLTAHYNFTPKT